MLGNEKLEKFLTKFPHPHKHFFNRPDVSRRRFFEIAGTGILGSYLVRPVLAADAARLAVTTKSTADNVIFVLLTGAISHTDSFDLKMVNGVTPSSFAPAKIGGVDWPTGLLPKLGEQLPNFAIARSVKAWALVHSLAQRWSQIGRSPVAALGDIAPNIGSVVAIEKERERKPGQVFPSFLALNSPSGAGPGYFSAQYAPFRVNQNGAATSSGIPNTSNALGQPRFNTMYGRLTELDGPLRISGGVGDFSDYDAFYNAARGMMYNDAVTRAFSYSQADSQRYGASGFGNACLVAKQVLEANQGTRFIQISFGSWDMHQNIYDAESPAGMQQMGKVLDSGLGTLLADLKANGQLAKTLVVVTGEFGRTVGALSGAQGRDHWLQQSVLFAGAGVKGGRAIGATDATGAFTTESGWSRGREIRPEDIEATIYSALGIDWTTIRMDDPYGRGFEYTPFAKDDIYGPVNELWS